MDVLIRKSLTKWGLLILAAVIAYLSGYVVGQNLKNRLNKDEVPSVSLMSKSAPSAKLALLTTSF